MLGCGTGDGVGDLMPERVQHSLWRTVLGIILGDLDAFRSVLAHAQPTFRIRQTESPAMQTVLRHFLAGDGFQFLQIHDRFP